MDKQRKFQAPMVGGSSLLVIFAVLCLTVFALLGFSTVQADRRLADASIAAVSAKTRIITSCSISARGALFFTGLSPFRCAGQESCSGGFHPPW